MTEWKKINHLILLYLEHNAYITAFNLKSIYKTIVNLVLLNIKDKDSYEEICCLKL